MSEPHTETESFLHSHSTMNRLIEEIQAHSGLLADPWMDNGESKAILEELLGFVLSFRTELQEHVEEEESGIFPMLKRRIPAQEMPLMEALYVEHRAIDAALSRALHEIERAMAAPDGGKYSAQIMDYIKELIDAFYEHSRNERQVFLLADVT